LALVVSTLHKQTERIDNILACNLKLAENLRKISLRKPSISLFPKAQVKRDLINKNCRVVGGLLRTQNKFSKIMKENVQILNRINHQYSTIDFRKSTLKMNLLESDFKKNREISVRIQRLKKNPINKSYILNDSLVFSGGRFEKQSSSYLDRKSISRSSSKSRGSFLKLSKSRERSALLSIGRHRIPSFKRLTLSNQRKSSQSISRESKFKF